MKLCVPPGCGAASHNGCALEIDAEGRVDVDEDAAYALAAHGFTALCETTAKDPVSLQSHAAAKQAQTNPLDDGISELNRPGLFAFLKERGICVSLPITNDQLRVLARAALAKAARDPSADEGS